jgi:hypothetical protein
MNLSAVALIGGMLKQISNEFVPANISITKQNMYMGPLSSSKSCFNIFPGKKIREKEAFKNFQINSICLNLLPNPSLPAPEANEDLAKATFYTENSKGEKRAGLWCRVKRLVLHHSS